MYVSRSTTSITAYAVFDGCRGVGPIMHFRNDGALDTWLCAMRYVPTVLFAVITSRGVGWSETDSYVEV